LDNDFFLVATKDDFIDSARLFIFETECRIHRTLSLPSLSEKLNLSSEEGEKWIVNLVRGSRIDAKIDEEKKELVVGGSETSIWKEVIEKTKGIGWRVGILVGNLEKRANELSARRNGQQQQSSSSGQSGHGHGNSSGGNHQKQGKKNWGHVKGGQGFKGIGGQGFGGRNTGFVGGRGPSSRTQVKA